jgi:hypothetical protein|nr:MAG TPA: hypothetical protein [Caudoviricetes sp.]
MTMISGKYFNRGLENNIAHLKGEKIYVHNFDGKELGIFRTEILEKETGEDFKMNLNKHDYDLLSKFSLLDIKKDAETIKCISGQSNFKFQNIKDMHEIIPDIKNLEDIDLDVQLFKKAAALVSKKDGVLIYPQGVCAYDKEMQFIYKYLCPLNIKEQINAPTNLLQLMMSNAKYSVKANKTLIALQSEGEMIYSSLFVKTNENIAGFDPQIKGEITFENPEQFKDILKQASGFNANAYLKIETKKGGGAQMSIQTLIDGNDPRVYTSTINVETNIITYKRAFSIAGILKCMSAIETNGKLIFKVNDKLLRIDGTNEFVTIAGMRTPEDTEIIITDQLKGVADDRNE